MIRILSLLAVLALAVAACGGATDTADTTTTTAAPAETTTTAPESTETTEAPPDGDATGSVTFVAGEGSQVGFEIAEVLRGEDVVVVARNGSVDVEATVDFDDPAASEIGVVNIDAAGFVTDEDRRNNAIQRFILDVADFPEITFTPTSFDGAADALAGGTGTITGDLTIRDVTVPVTFEVTATEASPDGITAEATATVDRTDWDLNIPSVPFVASVAEEVLLTLGLVLVPTG
jgi:polyisoprenoid-binding protein YceI